MFKKQKVRYAVVGLGYISQIAVLPAFQHAESNSELVALVSNDPEKLVKLARKYRVKLTYTYDEYEDCLNSGLIDAVYIALPNNMHLEYTVRAARAGKHVLCEKPMAVTESECAEMMRAAKQSQVKLMVAYRLHFEKANLSAIELVKSGKLGDVRVFNSVFSMQVKKGNIRLQKEMGGGTLYDIGIYCINAARNLFRDEPTEVFAFSANSGDKRFQEVDEMTSVILRFSNERLASFTTSFGVVDSSYYEIFGTNGKLRVEPAYEIASDLKHILTLNNKTKTQTFNKRDQFAPELIYFSNCVLHNKDPEPSGVEGLADVRVIRALYRSAKIGEPVKLSDFNKPKRPGKTQEIKKLPPVQEPELFHAQVPHD